MDEQQVFAGVNYVLDESLSSIEAAELDNLLESAGGTRYLNEPDAPDNPSSSITHIISNTMHIQHASAWKEQYKQVTICTPAWVHRSRLIGKQDAKFFSPDPDMIFSGHCVNCASDIPQSDMEAIYGAVTALGGQYREMATKEVTHIVCLVLQPANFDRVNSANLGIKFVLPHWFEACIRSKKLTPSLPYEYLTSTSIPLCIQPEVQANPASSHERAVTEALKALSRTNKTQRAEEKRQMYASVAAGEDQEDVSASHVKTFEESDSARVFAGKKVLLGEELCLSDHLKETLEEWVVTAGGEVGTSEREMEMCDIYITKWRDGDHYLKAVRHGLTIGTLAWFYHVVAIGRLSSPKDQLLHYPVPREGIEGFKNMSITVTNYTGDSRDYLKKLITAIGAEFTTTMSADTDYLIAANKIGEKVARCDNWSIHLVNHLFLEECFRRWERVSPTGGDGRFTDFSSVLNYMDLVGDASLTDEELERWTKPAFEQASTAEEEEMGEIDRGMLGTARTELPATNTPNVPHLEAQDDPMDGGAREVPVAGPSRLPKRQAPVASTSKKVADTATPLPKRRRKGSVDGPLVAITTPGGRGLESGNILSAGSKRGAAAAAALKVHESALDANKFEKEKKRKDPISPQSRKASRVQVKQEEGEESSEEETAAATPIRKGGATQKAAALPARAKGRARRGSSTMPPASVVDDAAPDTDLPVVKGTLLGGGKKIKWMATGVALTDAENKAMGKFGTKQATLPEQVTHLICKNITRTPKFMRAISHSPIIVTHAWVKACVAAGQVVDETPYFLQDHLAEKTYGFALQESLARAKALKAKGGLMHGQTFYITDNVETEFEVMSQIVKAAGGEVMRYAKSKQRLLEAQSGDKHLVSCIADRAIWAPLLPKGVKVYDRELILKGLLIMQLDYAAHELR